MPLKREQKKEIIDSLKKAIKDSPSLVFVNFHGLNVSEANEMRRSLLGKEIQYFVAKKTLTKKALEGQNLKGQLPSLEGEIAVAFGNDLLSPAREIYQFQKKFDNKVSIIGGIFEGSYKDKESMISIAMIPSKDILYGQFLNIINSPIQGFVLALNAIAEKK